MQRPRWRVPIAIVLDQQFFSRLSNHSLTQSLFRLPTLTFTMFARVAAFTVLALPVFAAATPAVLRRGDCNTGSIQCCNSVHEVRASLHLLFGGVQY